MYFNNKIVDLFTIFEDDESATGWDTELIMKELISEIANIEDTILISQTLLDWEKTALFASTITAKAFVASLDDLTQNIDPVLISRGFFKKVWKGVSKVAKVVATVTVATTVTVARAVGFTIVGGLNGAINNLDSGMLGAAGAGAGCAIAGAVSGFFGGIYNGIKCDAFDVQCMIGDYNKIPCVNN